MFEHISQEIISLALQSEFIYTTNAIKNLTNIVISDRFELWVSSVYIYNRTTINI